MVIRNSNHAHWVRDDRFSIGLIKPIESFGLNPISEDVELTDDEHALVAKGVLLYA